MEISETFEREVRAMYAAGMSAIEIKATIDAIVAKVNTETATKLFGPGA